MGWEKDKSDRRIGEHLENLEDIHIEPLVREADLDDLLSETNCREIFGAHVYVDVPNIAQLSSEPIVSKDGYARLIRAIHCYERALIRIITDLFDGTSIHFQGAKMHALFYRPINDQQVLATKAVLFQLVARDYVSTVFNAVFPDYVAFETASGSDIGTTIGTKSGQSGSRELLFVGPAANHAAHIVPAKGIRISEDVFTNLPDDLQKACTKSSGVYRITMTSAELDSALQTQGVKYDRERTREALEKDRDAVPLSEIQYSDANVKIDFTTLSIRNNKRFSGVSVFADLSGFTAFVEEAETDEEKTEALRIFAVARREFSRVLRTDYDGVFVQHQGDRIQGILHLPKDDESQVAMHAIEIAAAMQSSLDLIKVHLPAAEPLGLAIGIDYGRTLASSLGERGDRDNLCVGKAVVNAARIQEASDDSEIAISGTVFDALSEDLQSLFAHDDDRDAYVAIGLTFSDIELAQKALMHDKATHLSVGAVLGAAGLGIAAAAIGIAAAAKKEQPGTIEVSRPYAPDEE